MSAAVKKAAVNTCDIVDAIQSNASSTSFLAALEAAGLCGDFKEG